jgi:uncharacterized protein DUF397
MARKPTLAELGIDPDDLYWQRSGAGEGSLEVAFVGEAAGPPSGRSSWRPGDGGLGGAGAAAGAQWVLLRVAGDPEGRVLVYDRTEWTCFLDGVSRGEFG